MNYLYIKWGSTTESEYTLSCLSTISRGYIPISHSLVFSKTFICLIDCFMYLSIYMYVKFCISSSSIIAIIIIISINVFRPINQLINLYIYLFIHLFIQLFIHY